MEKSEENDIEMKKNSGKAGFMRDVYGEFQDHYNYAKILRPKSSGEQQRKRKHRK